MQNNPLKITLILLLAALLMHACDDSGEEQPDPSAIEFTLTSQDDGILADIEYTSVFGMVIKLEDEPIPWSTGFNAIFETGDALSLKVESGAQSEITAQIIVDDTMVARETAKHYIQLEYILGLK